MFPLKIYDTNEKFFKQPIKTNTHRHKINIYSIAFHEWIKKKTDTFVFPMVDETGFNRWQSKTGWVRIKNI